MYIYHYVPIVKAPQSTKKGDRGKPRTLILSCKDKTTLEIETSGDKIDSKFRNPIRIPEELHLALQGGSTTQRRLPPQARYGKEIKTVKKNIESEWVPGGSTEFGFKPTGRR